MGIFPNDDDDEEVDDRFAEDVLAKATSPSAFYVDVDDIIDAYNWLAFRERFSDAGAVLDFGLRLLVDKAEFASLVRNFIHHAYHYVVFIGPLVDRITKIAAFVYFEIYYAFDFFKFGRKSGIFRRIQLFYHIKMFGLH